MRRIWFAVAVMVVAVCCASAQDPVKVDAQEYKVELENNYVRVLRATRAPLSKTPVHEHPAYVLLPLTDVHQRITSANGKVQEITLKAGTAAFSNPVKHEEENLEDAAAKVILIEFKTPAGTIPESVKGAPVPPEFDPIKIDPKYHSVILENDRVRVIRTVLEPHIKSPMHAHPAYVVLYLTDLHTTMAMADGSVRDNPRHAGDVAWRDALKHSTENTQEQRAVELQVELK